MLADIKNAVVPVAVIVVISSIIKHTAAVFVGAVAGDGAVFNGAVMFVDETADETVKENSLKILEDLEILLAEISFLEPADVK